MIADQALTVGRKLGDYQLVVPLARGATADVWAARTLGSRLERIVAMKVMRLDDPDDDEAESMFLDEARLVARIQHPNVASVLDLGESDELLYLVVEWIDGEPLQVLVKEAWGKGGEGIPLPIALRIARLAASGLDAAHELRGELGETLNIVHRDVSPQNILVGYDGTVKVIDFGVAKAASNIQRTRVGQIKGKVPYMAPEQAAGAAVDRRTDIFALGIVLYQLVTGKHPFRGENEFSTLARLRDKVPFESARTHRPDLPDAVDELLTRALAKEIDARFPTMNDLVRALDRAIPSTAGDAELRAYAGAMLGSRAQRKHEVIKEALASLREEGARAPAPGPVAAPVAAPPPAAPAAPPPESTPEPAAVSKPEPASGPSPASAPSPSARSAPSAAVATRRAPATAPPAGPAAKARPREKANNTVLVVVGVVVLLGAMVAGVALGLR